MEMNVKRERNSNYSREETEKLISLVEGYVNVIENKKSDAVTWQEKERAWKAIEADFNRSGSGTYRNAKHLKLKYEAMKKDLRKKSIIRAEQYRTGGVNGAPPLTPIEKKVKQMIFVSVEGHRDTDTESVYDSDQMDVPALDVKREFIDPVESNGRTDNLVGAADHSKQQNGEYYYDDSVASTSCVDVDIEVIEPPPKKWADWNSSKKHPVLCKPREKRLYEKLTGGKIEIVELQKKAIEEELEEKKLKRKLMENELQYKKELFELEKEERLLKIEILKRDLQNKKT